MKHGDTSKGSTNALHDLALEDAQELTVKTQLAMKLNALIDSRQLSQADVAQLTGMHQPRVSAIRHYKLQNISLERLMLALVALDQRIEITVREARHRHACGITVAA